MDSSVGAGSGPLKDPRRDREEVSAKVDRSKDGLFAHSGLRGLLRANRMIAGDLALPIVLRRIVEAACQLVDARYGALGVIAPGGGLEQFIHVGMDEETVARIGHLRQGGGLLGALMEDSRLIRLGKLGDDPRSVGLPPYHPPMGCFLGVPIRVRDEVYGNLYLTGHDDGEISDEDEELVQSLAASAGVAIENARLFDEARRRQDWLQAATEITRQLLSNEGQDPLWVIARRLQQIADADAVNVILPTSDGQRLIVEVAIGASADELVAVSYPIGKTVSELVLATGRPVLIGDMAEEDRHTVHLSEVVPVGPLMVLPLVGTERIRGVVIVGRLRGRSRFTAADLDMASTFANHAAIALELADSRAAQERIALLEEKDRIARDLHDHVIQRLFGTGLTVQSVASGLGTAAGAERLMQVVDDIDATIRRVRTSIFDLRGPLGPQTGGVRARLLSVATEMAPLLGFEPGLGFAGPLDAVIPAAVLDDLVAVVREALTNVVRHAHASQVEVEVTDAHGDLAVEITDDGVGIGEARRCSGLANLRERAARLGGALDVTSPAPPSSAQNNEGGTHLRWTIPLG